MLIQADARQIPLADKSIHCVVTSPPYWGLRDYGTAQWAGGREDCDHIESELRRGVNLAQSAASTRGGAKKIAAVGGIPFRDVCGKCGAVRHDRQLGLESSPEEYIAEMVDVFREVKRVLRDDGTLWLNMGDSYCSGTTTLRSKRDPTNPGEPRNWNADANKIARNGTPAGYKAKDMLGMPWMLALALRADGWYLRSDIIWYKKNPMPESTTDRPTKSHEHIFLLAKSERYFYDGEAIKEPVTGNAHSRGEGLNPKGKLMPAGNGVKQNESMSAALAGILQSEMRNKRDVWEVAIQQGEEAHYATFPEDLIRPCILAGTSMKGACARCGAPWKRIIEKKPSTMNVRVRGNKKGIIDQKSGIAGKYGASEVEVGNYGKEETGETRTVGWAPTCTCGVQEIVPCIVLDPFMGSGTTELVARSLQCQTVGLELNPAYIEIARKRLAQQVMQWT